MTEPLEIQKSQRNGCILSLKSIRTCVPDWESGLLRSLYKDSMQGKKAAFFFPTAWCTQFVFTSDSFMGG